MTQASLWYLYCKEYNEFKLYQGHHSSVELMIRAWYTVRINHQTFGKLYVYCLILLEWHIEELSGGVGKVCYQKSSMNPSISEWFWLSTSESLSVITVSTISFWDSEIHSDEPSFDDSESILIWACCPSRCKDADNSA